MRTQSIMTPTISVVTLTHNKLEYSRRCLTSLLATSFGPWELVVIDNGSSDGTREWLKELGAQAEANDVGFQTVLNDGNIGCSTARNQGSAVARGHYVVFVDNDIALRSQNWLRDLANCLDRNPECAMVGPKLVYPYPPHDIQCAGSAVSRSGRVQFMGRGESNDSPRHNQRREVQCLISACIMVRKTVLDQAGGFDEAFNPVEYEDIDLCYRMRSLGHRLIYEPAVSMYHFESVTTAGTEALPNTYLIVKHGLLFKGRWREMFVKEDGPTDEETKWKKIPGRSLESVSELEILRSSEESVGET
jgi:GT2 family glycosyltransferase